MIPEQQGPTDDLYLDEYGWNVYHTLTALKRTIRCGEAIIASTFRCAQFMQFSLHTDKDPNTAYVEHITQEEMAMFKSWGFNLIRLGISQMNIGYQCTIVS